MTFLEEGIVLRHTAQGEFIHEVDLVRLAHPLVLRAVNGSRNKSAT